MGLIRCACLTQILFFLPIFKRTPGNCTVTKPELIFFILGWCGARTPAFLLGTITAVTASQNPALKEEKHANGRFNIWHMRSSLFSFPFATAVTKLHSALVFFLPVTDTHPGKQIHRLNRDNSREWGILGSNCPDLCKVFNSSGWKLAAPGATLGSFLQGKLGLGQQSPRREIWLAQRHG